MDSSRSRVFVLALLVFYVRVDAGNVCPAPDTGFTHCGVPTLTADQIANIDTNRVELLRQTMMNLPTVPNVTTGGRGPLVVNHPGVEQDLLRPIVPFTGEQLNVYTSKYGNNRACGAVASTSSMSTQAEGGISRGTDPGAGEGRRKRSTSGIEACEGNRVQTTIFAITTDGRVVEFPRINFWFSIGCFPSEPSSVCDNCMEEEICLPIFCYTIDPPYTADTYEIIVKRCTCFD